MPLYKKKLFRKGSFRSFQMKCNDVKQLLEVNRGKGSCSVYVVLKEQSTEESGPARKSAKKKKYRSDSKDDPFHFVPATRLLLNTPQIYILLSSAPSRGQKSVRSSHLAVWHRFKVVDFNLCKQAGTLCSESKRCKAGKKKKKKASADIKRSAVWCMSQ